MQWVTVTTAPNEPLGEVLAQLLRNNDIPARVQSDVLSLYVGSVITPVRVMVPTSREAEGRALLQQVIGPWDPEEPGD